MLVSSNELSHRQQDRGVDQPVVGQLRGDLLVAIPALNEEDSIVRVISAVRCAQPDAVVLVIDDGSTDRTAALARQAGALVMSLPFNLGVGGAMRAAYRYAQCKSFRFVVQVDADGQHEPGEISDLIAASDGVDIVIGARFAGKGEYGVRGPRRWAMRLLAEVLSWVIGARLTDPTSGSGSSARERPRCLPGTILRSISGTPSRPSSSRTAPEWRSPRYPSP